MQGTVSKCYLISDECRHSFGGILRDLNNPHTLGIEANEAFFLEDGIILVEGQEDVVVFNKMAQELNMTLKGNFFGWGVGGASKMKAFLILFKDLGYKKIVAVLDGDKAADAEKLSAEFSEYKIITLKEDDIRDKKAREIQAKSGIADEKGNYKEEYKEYTIGFDKRNQFRVVTIRAAQLRRPYRHSYPTLSNGITLHRLSSGGSGGSGVVVAVADSMKPPIFSAAPLCISLVMCV